MGFGLLLIGYFLTNILPAISVFSAAMLIGYPLITLALYRLAPYHKKFYISMWVSLPALLFACYYTLYSLVTLGLLPEFSILNSALFAVVEWLYFAYTLVLNFLILWSIASLTRELGLYDVQSTAWRNLTFVGIYNLIYFIIKLPIPFFLTHSAAFAIPITLLRYLCIFLNLWLFFRCYRLIMPEGSDVVDIHNVEKKEAKK